MQKVKLKPKKNGRVGQFLRKFAEIVIAGGPHYIQPLCSVRFFEELEIDHVHFVTKRKHLQSLFGSMKILEA